jgi:hypothetical protein
MLHPLCEKKRVNFFQIHVTFDLYHTQSLALQFLSNDVFVSVLCQGFESLANGSSTNTLVDMVASHHRFIRKFAMSLLVHGKQLGVA